MDHYRLYSPEQFALDKYFQEWVLTPTSSSNHAWSDFVNQHPYKKAAIDEAIELVRLSGLSADSDANNAYLDNWHHIRQNAVRSKSTRTLYYRVAAAVAGLMIIAFAAYRYQLKNNDVVLYATGFGETKKITLEDGTSITLNSKSTLSVSENSFKSGSRDVTIDGDAFFEVVHTSNNTPFVVHIPNNTEVHVLGTSFNVKYRNNDVKVYLQSGKIRLVKGNVEQIMSPGDEANISNTSNTIAIQKLPNTKAEENLAWLKNQYVMNDLPLSVVADNISEIFGKVVMVEDTSLFTKRVTAKVPANDLKVLVEVLSQALEIKIEEKENHLYIRKQ